MLTAALPTKRQKISTRILSLLNAKQQALPGKWSRRVFLLNGPDGFNCRDRCYLFLSDVFSWDALIMINSRSLSDLRPKVAELAQAFIEKCHDAGIDVIITSTYRDIESQNALFAVGRKTPGDILTNAKGGDSFHNYKVAFDFCPMVYGKCAWNDHKLFGRCGLIAESVGLEWSGRFHSMPEQAHCQWRGGLSLQDFKDGRHLIS
jgi:peptidoglycan L-alanyl-D-glutamate endopeptidase CwlK